MTSPEGIELEDMMSTTKALKIPKWVCETHLRELEDLIDSGEFSYAQYVLDEGKEDWRGWCADCAGTSRY